MDLLPVFLCFMLFITLKKSTSQMNKCHMQGLNQEKIKLQSSDFYFGVMSIVLKLLHHLAIRFKMSQSVRKCDKCVVCTYFRVSAIALPSVLV